MKVRVRVEPPKTVTVSVVVLVRHADNVRIGPKTITENGTFYPANESLDGYSPVVVDVKAQPKLQDKTVDPAIVPVKVKADPPNDGLGEVTVNAMPVVEQVTPQITVNEETGVVTARASQPSGYVVGGTKENSKQLETKGAQIYTPGDEEKIIPAGAFLTGKQTFAKVPTQETTITENGEHIPPSGKYYSKVVVAVPESGGTDTDDANATPSDMAAGTSGYVKGEKVEGILPVKAAGTTETAIGEGLAIEGGKLKMTTTAPADSIRRAGAKTEVETNADALGVATPDMVLKDATFTSKDGIGQEGTIPRNGDTSATIDGIETKSVEIPAGYTTGGVVALDGTIDGHVDDQATLIAEIAEALENKAAGGGSGGSDDGDPFSDVTDRILYELPSETVFDGVSTYIDTGLALMAENKDFTIIISGKVGAGNSINDPVFHCLKESTPYAGLSMQMGAYGYRLGGYINYFGSGTDTDAGLLLIPTGEGTVFSAAITHKKINDSFWALTQTKGSYLMGQNYITDYGDTYDQSVTSNLLLGCYQNTSGTKGRYWAGTLYDFRVYDFAMDSVRIEKYLAKVNDLE